MFVSPYGDDYKFVHMGEGGCRIVTPAAFKKNGDTTDDDNTTKKKSKCFSFRSKGKCKLGDDFPYSHDVTESSSTTNNDSNNNSLDIIHANWNSFHERGA